MCGIAGIVGSPDLIQSGLPEMASVLASRGPDGLGFATYSPRDKLTASPLAPPRVTQDPSVGLAHRRLAIIDTSSDADQPFLDKDGTFALVFNGEIYNFLELRSELVGAGVEFRTASDTEVLLAAYRFWGPACVKHFIGMWAFAILDTIRGTVFLSRDPFGIKPLYVTRINGSLAFASEIKALLRLRPVKARPDLVAVSRYLQTGTILDTERTFFEGIDPFPAAAWCEIDVRTPSRPLDIHYYWHLPTSETPQTFGEAADSLRAGVFDAVRLQLRSDVPVGTSLSGGLDSSSIVSVAATTMPAAHIQHPHLAFGFCSADEQVTERQFMEIAANAAGVEFVPVTASQQEVARQLPEIISYHDEPFGDPSIVAQWFVFRRAHEARVKVLLAGEGADEMLGGYSGCLHFLALRMLRTGRLRKFARFRQQHKRNIGPLGLSRLQILRALAPDVFARLARGGLSRLGGGRVALPGMGLTSLFRDELLHLPGPQLHVPAEDRNLHELLERQLTRTSLPQLLRYEDRNSMAHSIEARVPFLDHRLVELAFGMSDDKKIVGVETKAVLRRAMQNVVPQAILDRRDKTGFRATPSWTYEYARENMSDLAANDTEHERAWFEPKATAALLKTERRDARSEFLLWRVLNTKLWARALLD